LVDDSPAIRAAVRAYLEPTSGLNVCGEACDGLEAIEKAQQLCPDLIIMDFSMPRMNGLVAAREIKRKLPNVPIILFTSYKSAVHDSDATAAGISATICKSEDHTLLMTQILLLLGRA
jgi:DNA-binding NarL/FixJ family response regulator